MKLQNKVLETFLGRDDSNRSNVIIDCASNFEISGNYSLESKESNIIPGKTILKHTLLQRLFE